MVSSQGLDIWEVKIILFSSPAILFSVSNEILLPQDCFTDVSALRQDQQLPQQSEKNFYWNFLTCIYFNLPFLLISSFKFFYKNCTIRLHYWHSPIRCFFLALYCLSSPDFPWPYILYFKISHLQDVSQWNELILSQTIYVPKYIVCK